MAIETIIVTFGYFAILIFMITNGVVSLPSSQFVYVTAGVFAPTVELSILWIAIAGTTGNVIGNTILYEMSRRNGMEYLRKWRGFSEEKIEKLRIAFDRRGLVVIFFGKFLPGIKIVVPVVAGLAEMNRVLFFVIISITSYLWALGLTYFGFYFGSSFNDNTFGWYSVGLLFLAGIVIYMFYKYVERIQPK